MTEKKQNQMVRAEMAQPLLNQYTTEFMRDLLDPSVMVDKFEQSLRGIAYNSEKNCWMQVTKPKMNEEGVAWIRMETELFSDKTFTTSNFSKEEIDRDLEDFEHTLIEHMFSHYNEYDLDYVSDMRMILTMVRGIVSASRKKSQNATMIKNLSKSHQHTEIHHEGENQHKRNMLSGFLGGKKR